MDRQTKREIKTVAALGVGFAAACGFIYGGVRAVMALADDEYITPEVCEAMADPKLGESIKPCVPASSFPAYRP
jgi:hypothetical protein